MGTMGSRIAIAGGNGVLSKKTTGRIVTVSQRYTI